jgi:hypothetical protein
MTDADRDLFADINICVRGIKVAGAVGDAFCIDVGAKADVALTKLQTLRGIHPQVGPARAMLFVRCAQRPVSRSGCAFDCRYGSTALA